MAEIYVTSTADSGSGSLRQAIADAADGDVILFDPVVFPQGQTTTIYLSSSLKVVKSLSIYGGFSDGAGGYTSAATKRFYVYREVDDVNTKVYIDTNNPAQENETVLFDLVCRVRLDRQNAGSFVYVYRYSLNLYGLEICNTYADDNGSCLYFSEDSDNYVVDCALINCNATSLGAGVYSAANSIVTLNDCVISGCSAASGAGIYATGTSQNTLNDCCFDGCVASSAGGVAYFTSYTHNTLNNCVINNCTASTNGGGVVATSYSTNNLVSCFLCGCNSDIGGAFYSGGANESALSNCVFNDCTATKSGGAVYLTTTNQTTITDCAITNCTAESTGGAVFANVGTTIINNCAIANCSASANGGGLYTAGSSNCTLTGCTITLCSATNYGGAVYSYGSSQNTLNDCAITGCVANYGGGAFSTSTTKLELNNCTLTNCVANIYAGGVCVYAASQAVLIGCTISGCTAATRGGGLYALNTSQVTLNDCTITGCHANLGGGTYFANSGRSQINNCVLLGNTTAGSGSSKDVLFDNTAVATISATQFGYYYSTAAATITFTSGVTTIATSRIDANATITINDGAALTLTGTATIGAATFTSSGRGYLAVAPRINVSAAMLTNVVLCAYGADVSSFAEVDGVLEWDADDPSVSVLLEREDNDAWTTLTQTTGDELDYYLPPKVNLRLFDGERFLTTATPDSRTYFYIGGAEGSFDDAEDWSLTKNGTAILQSPTITDCAFVIQGAEGDVAISKGSADVTNATIIPAGTNDIAVVVDEATVLAGTERFTGTLTTTGDVTITGDASKLAIVVDGTLEVAGSLKLATLTLTSGSSVVFASADDVLVVTDSATVNDATFSCEEPTAYFTAPVGTDLTQATFTNVYVATKGAEVESVTGSRFGKNYSINIISEDNTLPVTVEYRLEGTTEWIVADPAFVGTTFQIRLDDEATFRVYNGEKFTEATMKVYGLYNEMAAIVEIGYLI